MNNETIKDQVRRLIAGIAPCYGKSPDLIKDDDYCFGFMVQVVELAIAEEREAVAPYLNSMAELLSEAEEFEGEDGLMMGADINLWSEADKALDELIDKQDAEVNHWKPLQLRHSAPKDEVNQ